MLDYEGYASWAATQDVSGDALRNLSDDPNTSLWDEGNNHVRLNDVLVALSLARRTISRLEFGSLWQMELGGDLAGRIIQRDDTGPYEAARRLHYELQNPKEGDYAELALGLARRGAFDARTPKEIKDLLEDAVFERKFDPDDLNSELRGELQNLLDERFIEPQLLAQSETQPPIIDIRPQAGLSIRGSIRRDPARLRADGYIYGINAKAVSVLYCGDGEASRKLAQHLRLRHRAIKTVKGGFASWEEAGLATE